MSYPGHNGFSLSNEELRNHPGLMRFLQDAADYGDLYCAEHTTKRRDRKQRTKWYLNPILSPQFQIPESHVKEPYYATVANVAWWLREADVTVSGLSEVAAEPPRRGLEAVPEVDNSGDLFTWSEGRANGN